MTGGYEQIQKKERKKGRKKGPEKLHPHCKQYRKRQFKAMNGAFTTYSLDCGVGENTEILKFQDQENSKKTPYLSNLDYWNI